jgi:hypothetical protein
MACPGRPQDLPITTTGAVTDPEPPARDDWDDLEDYVSAPVLSHSPNYHGPASPTSSTSAPTLTPATSPRA